MIYGRIDAVAGAFRRAAHAAPEAADRVAAFTDSSRWVVGRRCFAGVAADSAGNGASTKSNRGEPAVGAAALLRGRQHAGRRDHDSRRALCDSGEGGVEAARAGSGARRELERADGVRGAAGDDRAEQRSGAAARRRAGGDSSHLCGHDAADRAVCAGDSEGCGGACRGRHAAGAGALCAGVRLRSSRDLRRPKIPS